MATLAERTQGRDVTWYNRSAEPAGAPVSLQAPFRVQIAFMRFEPYAQSADLSVKDRLATVVRQDESSFFLMDDEGDKHVIDTATLGVAASPPAEGRWVMRSPIPTYCSGEEVTISWRYRNGCLPLPRLHERLPDRVARVVEELPDRIFVEDEAGERHEIYRYGVECVRDGRPRNSPRWRIIERRGRVTDE